MDKRNEKPTPVSQVLEQGHVVRIIVGNTEVEICAEKINLKVSPQ